MNQFSASEAALEGFRLTRERPGTILAWGGVYFLGIMIMAAVMAVGLGPKFIDFVKKGGLESGDAEAFGSLLAQSWPAFLVVLLVAVVLLSILTAGIYRLVLRPQEVGFAHLRLGRDEVRLAAVNLLLFGIGMVCLFVVELVTAAAAQHGGPGVAAIAAVAVAAPTIWIGVRLSMVTPMSFAARKITIRSAWELTRGRFWPLFGMIVLAVIFYIMIWMLITVIGYVIVTLAGGQQAIADMSHPAPGAVIAFIASLIIQLLLPILQVVMIYAPFAVAYQQLHGDQPANPLRAHAQSS
jgi:hypothetical protein